MNSLLKLMKGTTPVVMIFALALTAYGDTLRLKDGSIIKGKITSFGSGTFVIAIGEGSRKRELKFGVAEVESIQFDTVSESSSSPTNRTAAYSERNASPAATQTIKKEENQAAKQSSPTATIKPIEWRVKVLADSTANGWTNSGWVVKKGQRIRIAADDGTVSLGKGRKSDASGIGTLEDPMKLLKNVPTGALIAVIGDDNNDFIYVGSEREFVATRDGALFLGINEGNLDDNSGAFNVKIEIIPS
jgi:hypothetical protein